MTGPLERRFRMVRAVYRTFGWRGLHRRAVHELRRRAQAFRERPATAVHVPPTASAARYAPSGDWSIVPPARRAAAMERGRRVLAGNYEAFGHSWRPLPSGSEAWSTHPRVGYRFPSTAWWNVPSLPAGVDIKEVWEPARFGWAYDLVRAYALSGDAAYAEDFHQRLAEWIASNPPFRGVHWSCGQEAAIRALAVLHADAILPAPEGDADAARERVASLLAWTGERITDAIGYGLSQRNNHGISEASALVHLGVHFAGAHPRAANWLDRGARLLDEQIIDQFADDGWYAQHSFTYMRVAMEQALLAQRILRTVGRTLDADALRRLGRGFDLLVTLVDGDTGVVPNHGASDGARVLPLSSAPYRDFRPLLTLAALILDRSLPSDVPPDHEVVSWLGGSAPRVGDARPNGVVRGESGWVAAHVDGTRVFLRAGQYRHRPSHLDLLHLDVRFGSREVVTDPGTYAYNADGAWANGLASARVHNGPVLDDREPAEKGARFLWYSWPSARLVGTEWTDGEARLVAEVPGRVRREVHVRAGSVLVRDRVLDPSVGRARVSWLLHPTVNDVRCVQSDGATWLAATDSSVDGWFSSTYALREPSRSVVVVRDATVGPIEVRTTITEPRG